MWLSEKHNGKQPQRETKKKVGGLFSWLHYMADVCTTFDPTLIYIYTIVEQLVVSFVFGGSGVAL